MIETRGYAATVANAPLTPFVFKRRDLGPQDVQIAISYAGICHSDIHQVREEWGPSNFPMVPGHEIVGNVVAIGDQVTKHRVGDVVGIGVFVNACRECENCRSGQDQYCLTGTVPTYNGFELDGVTPTYGGYAKMIVADERYVLRIPASLPITGVSPLLCAGITLFSPLKHWNAGPDKNVGIIGLGGLGHLGVKFARALGAEVTVFSHSAKKEADARLFGASHFVLGDDKEEFQKLANSFDLIISTVSADLNLNRYLKLLRINSTLAIIGLPGKPLGIEAFNLLDQRRSISGSMVGGIAETQEMLDFA
ncbi:MAG TPA: NAD(P)-dependent alcohol dehydrogenase, partial [Candidatus Nanopelagicaceae bacterium]|nr:NAD(P)-dependent alcohol dehydrogenase [Candidatus Nanopelagicaceae bacterium]